MSAHRQDIDGMRALAVAAVVAFHAGLPFSDGGFVGVDVFFVLSGFLITGILSAEADKSGSIRLGRFYTRRLRRLLPASTLTVLTTLVASMFLLSPLRWEEIARTATAASLYVANFFFGSQAGDYFASDVQENPLLHFWSLAVEEQFYVVWPLLILVLSKRGAKFRLAGVAAVGLASFIYSLTLTSADSPWAYYSPLSRGWEFVAGGLLALLLPKGLAHLSDRRREAVAWAGLGLIGGSLLLITESTPFPGVAAVPTVLGTCLLIAATLSNASFLGRLLSTAPFQTVGALSYSWYLWHWPVLIIGQAYLANNSMPVRAALALGSLLPAAASYYLLERPVRFAPILVKRTSMNWAMAGILLIVAVAAASLVTRSSESELASPEFSEIVQARDDFPNLRGRGCDVGDTEYLLENCTFGPENALRTVVVLGDSHAMMWTTAFEALADEQDTRFTVHVLGGCNVAGLNASITTQRCREVQAGTFNVVEALGADAVIVSHYAELANGHAGDAWATGIESFLADASDRGIAVGWIHDVPALERNPVECVGVHPDEVCKSTRAITTASTMLIREVEEPLLQAAGATTFDPLPHMCGSNVCELRSDGVFRYRDNNHISASFAAQLAPELNDFLERLWEASEPNRELAVGEDS